MIKKCIDTGRAIQDKSKKISCVPATELKNFLMDICTAFLTRVQERENRRQEAGFINTRKNGFLNERLYVENAQDDIRNENSLISQQYCGDTSNIISVVHTGGERALSIHGRSITKKADATLMDALGNRYNVSVKMCENAYLHGSTVENFITDALLRETRLYIPEDVILGLRLFIHAPESNFFDNILNNNATHPDEIKHRRLFLEHLLNYNPRIAQRMLEWFTENQNKLFKICAITGNIANPEEYITHFAFVDMLGKHNSINVVIPAQQVLSELEMSNAECSFNPKGTQIILPWGTLESHKDRMFFKIDLKRIERSIGHKYENAQYNGLVLAN